MSGYSRKLNLVDKLCEGFVALESIRPPQGKLTYDQMREVFWSFKIKINREQMYLLVEPLP